MPRHSPITSLLPGSTAAIVVAVLAWCSPAGAAPDAELWERWTAHDASSTITVDHGAWDGFLKKHVSVGDDGIARLAYGGVGDDDRAALENYIAMLADVPVSGLNRASQKAYWINLYNAVTVDVVLDHWPVETIRDIDISPGLFSNGPWGKELVTVAGEDISLDDIEHRILRPIWQDPRIHYAVNCAALGCPNLWPRAVTPRNLDDYLNRGARAYVNHPRGSRIEGGELYVSSIYVWFQEDFGGDDAGVIEHLKRYAEPDHAEALDGIAEIDDDGYDWSINAASPSR